MNFYPLLRNVNNINAKPILKWAGGKGALLPQLSDKFPNKLRCGAIKRYIEPFIGGAAVFFEICNTCQFEEAFLFDINPELIILYNVVKYDVSTLIDELSLLQKAYAVAADKSVLYYDLRNEYNAFDKQINTNFYQSNFIRRAALTVFLNHTCFNGLFRVNRKGFFNVPMGRYANPRILDADNLTAVSHALSRATVVQADFATALKYADKNTFIYYDPPYRPLSNTSFTSYAADCFDDNEQRRLKNVFVEADKLGALQMLSNSDPTNSGNDSFFDDLYKGYNIHRIWAKRQINSKADGRSAIRELLITNYTQ
ncbi:MAG TPA: N-6 DNA methylase [Alphaproteobacteria bacterium]|nr:N-6 DNA methylase [Alphaproteobacteria bacterium]